MQDIRLTVQEAQEVFNKTRNTIYYWTRTNKVRFEDSEEGQILVFTQQEYDKMLKKHNPLKLAKQDLNSIEHNSVQNDSEIEQKDSLKGVQKTTQSNSDVLQEVSNIIESLKHFSDQAIESERSKVRLLEDSERRTENEYFELKSEFNQLKEQLQEQNFKLQIELNDYENKLNVVQKENEQLKMQLEQERNKPFWKRNVL